jgi:hypothetical protein
MYYQARETCYSGSIELLRVYEMSRCTDQDPTIVDPNLTAFRVTELASPAIALLDPDTFYPIEIALEVCENVEFARYAPHVGLKLISGWKYTIEFALWSKR